MQARKNEIAEENRRCSRSIKYRDGKQKINPARKQVFLTDTQTSDYTKSSGQLHIMRIQQLEMLVKELRKQNEQQKIVIINMKANQFFQLNEEKVKDLIKQNQILQNDLSEVKKEVQQLLIQRDFLKRFNKNLKAECANLTKQLMAFKSPFHYNQNSESRRIEKSISINNESSEDILRNYCRSSSQPFLISKRKQKNKQHEKEKQRREPRINSNVNLQQKSGNSNFQSTLNYEYFHGSFNLESKRLYKPTIS